MADADMPEMDCLEFVDKVHLIKDFPVILVSSELNKDAVEAAMAKGVSFFLWKPIPMKNLRNVWQHVCRKNKDKNPSQQGTVDKGEPQGAEPEKKSSSDLAGGLPSSSVAGNRISVPTEICNEGPLSVLNDDPRGLKRKRMEDEGSEGLEDVHLRKESNTMKEMGSKQSQSQVSCHLQTSYNREFLSSIPSPHSLEAHVNHQHRPPEQLSNLHNSMNRNPKLDELQRYANSTQFMNSTSSLHLS